MKPASIGNAALLFAVLSPQICLAAPSYTIIDLGTLGGSSSQPFGINNSGQVTGDALGPGDLTDHAFLYSGGLMSDLGTLTGDESLGFAINDIGHVVGQAATMGAGSEHAFLHSGGTMVDLNSLIDDPMSGWELHVATGINASGQVVGWGTLGGTFRGFLFSSGAVTSLGSFNANGINASGQVVGVSSSGIEAAMWDAGVVTGLGTLGGPTSIGLAINSLGQMVGYSTTAGGAAHAFFYSGGLMTDLGTLGGAHSNAMAINASGQVVGESQIANGEYSAFLYSGNVMLDLALLIDPLSGWQQLTQASGINDSGQIVGTGIIDGQLHAFLMNPVPEPSTSILAVFGLAGFAVWGWRRKR